VDHQKTCCAPPVFTKLHPSYHLNSTQPDHAMWQSPLFKISQPEQATCHNPPLTKLTTQILPRHHLLHLTHKTLTLIFLLSFQPPQSPSHLFMPPHHHRPATTPHLHLHVSPATMTHHRQAGNHRSARPSSPHLTPSSFSPVKPRTCASSLATISTVTTRIFFTRATTVHAPPWQLCSNSNNQFEHHHREFFFPRAFSHRDATPPFSLHHLLRTAPAPAPFGNHRELEPETCIADLHLAPPRTCTAKHFAGAPTPPATSFVHAPVLVGKEDLARKRQQPPSMHLGSQSVRETLILERESALPRVSI